MTQSIERSGSNGTDESLALQVFGAERLKVLKDQIAVGASDAELELFAEVCKRTKLDPFARQIWSIPRRRRNPKTDQWEPYQVIQIGVHGLRLIASRSREYAGQLGPLWCGPEGKWTAVWLSKEMPAAAKVGVKRKGFAEPIWSVAVWDRAVQRDSQNHPMALWKTRGPEQLALAAERDALRRAFPIETAGIEAVIDQSEQDTLAQRYDEILGDDVYAVDTRSGEVLNEPVSARELTSPEPSGGSAAEQVVSQSPSPAPLSDDDYRQWELEEVERQRAKEGLKG